MKKNGSNAFEADLMRELLSAIVTFMAQAGVGKEEISRTFSQASRQCFDQGKDRSRGRVPRFAYGCDTIAGAVLRAWHRNAEYLTENARPRALPLRGAGRSVLGLIRSLGSGEDAVTVFDSMLRARLIRKSAAGFVPAKESATIGALDPLAVDHVAKTVIRLVETASRNMSGKKGSFSLIERYAHVPNLAHDKSREFATFSRHQGQACLDVMEDWLEARQVSDQSPASRIRSVNAGVHIFAFVGKSATSRRVANRKARVANSPSAPA